jgi:hypothetical protein
MQQEYTDIMLMVVTRLIWKFKKQFDTKSLAKINIIFATALRRRLRMLEFDFYYYTFSLKWQLTFLGENVEKSWKISTGLHNSSK